MRATMVAVLLALLSSATVIILFAYPQLFLEPNGFTVVVRDFGKLVPGAGNVYGWVVVWGSAPGTAGLSIVKEARPSADRVVVEFPAKKLVDASKRALSATGKNVSGVGGASAVTVTLYLYDDRGNHYIASALMGSYELALNRLKDPIKAYQAVKRDPHYLYNNVRRLVFTPEQFAVVNATPTLAYISKTYYTHRSSASRSIVPTVSHRLTCSNVVTIDNYVHYRSLYGLDFSEEDFIALPELYTSTTPQEFRQRIGGANPDILFNRYKKTFSTAVYIPATCVNPVSYAVSQWYKVGPGLKTLDDFWTRIAGRTVEWADATQPGTSELLFDMPIVRLTGRCDQNCNLNRPRIHLGLAYAEYRYYVSGLSILGLIALGEEHEVLSVDSAGESFTPFDASQGLVAYILADIEREWYSDGVFVDYYVYKVNVYSFKDGRYYEFWRVEPILAFTPIHSDHILSLEPVAVTPEDEYWYNKYHDGFLEMLGYTVLTSTKIYDEFVSEYSYPSETIDSTAPSSYNADTLAGAVYGVAGEALKAIIAGVAERGSRLAGKLLGITGMVVSYTYANREAQATALKLERTSNAPEGSTVHVVVYRYEQYQGYNNTYTIADPEPPLAMTYYVVFNPRSGGPPPNQPYMPTEEKPAGK